MDCERPFDIANRCNGPAIVDRVAAQEDDASCKAAFATGPGQSEPHGQIRLPALAVLVDGDTRTEVVIVQVESEVGGPMLVAGYTFANGRRGVGPLSDLIVVESAG